MKSFRLTGAFICGGFAVGAWLTDHSSAGFAFLAMTILLALNARRPPGTD